MLRNPAFLLLATGALIGMNFPLGKIAGAAGISPVLWAWVISAGASATLFPLLLFQRGIELPRGQPARYAVISGLVSFVAANILLFTVIPETGSGYAGIMFALSPVFTLAMSVAFRLKSPSLLGLIGIAIGCAGGALVGYSRGSGPEAVSLFWMGVALLIPFTLAIGNVYRTIAWPKNASADQLAFWSHLVSAVVFLVILAVLGDLDLVSLLRVPWAALAQAVVAGLTFPLYFRLQQEGGPVLLSQIGYVAAAISLFTATAFLGESYGWLTWTGAAIVTLGIACTVAAQIRPARGTG